VPANVLGLARAVGQKAAHQCQERNDWWSGFNRAQWQFDDGNPADVFTETINYWLVLAGIFVLPFDELVLMSVKLGLMFVELGLMNVEFGLMFVELGLMNVALGLPLNLLVLAFMPLFPLKPFDALVFAKFMLLVETPAVMPFVWLPFCEGMVWLLLPGAVVAGAACAGALPAEDAVYANATTVTPIMRVRAKFSVFILANQ
jgi:hypothetical protein